MELLPLKTPRLKIGHDLFESLKTALDENQVMLGERDIVIVASKVVAYAQGRLVSGDDFEAVVRGEADQMLSEMPLALTLKNHILIPNAGVDKSNAPEGQVVLWPEKPFESARLLCDTLCEHFNLRELGVLITDSHCIPLRRGVSGLALGWAGFEGVRDERGTPDLFQKPLAVTQTAVADCLASAAEVLMGGGDAATPFVVVRDAGLEFTDREFSEQDYFIDPKDCLYNAVITIPKK